MTLAERGVYRPLWSSNILDELRRVLIEAGIEEAAVDHRIASMGDAFPGAKVSGYETLIQEMTCEQNDRHVLAAAVKGGASSLVTFNLKHFPPHASTRSGLTTVHPDDFLLDQLDLYPDTATDTITQVPAMYEHPPVTTNEFIDLLSRSGVPRFVATIKTLI